MSRAKSELEGTDKLRELILYISIVSEGDESFGSVKLNKLLFFCDFAQYRATGHSLTRQEYHKLAQGPAPRAILPLIEDMQKKGDVTLADRTYHGYRQRKPVALREPRLAGFTGSEIALVNHIVCEYIALNARDISLGSHEFIGWKLAGEGETIPYESGLLDDSEPTEEDIAFARSLDLTGVEALLK